MKKLFLSLTAVAFGYVNSNAQGSLLFVHNSPDPTVATVDVWVEVPEVPPSGYSVQIADNISFQQGYFASIPSVPIPGATLIVHIKDANSTSISDPDLLTKNYPSVPTGDNIAVLNGLADPTLAAAKTNPDAVSNAFDLTLQPATLSSSDPNKVSVFFHQGVVDLASTYFQSFITTIQSAPRDTLAQGVLYNDITNSVLSAAAPRRLHITASGQPQTTAIYPSNGDVFKTLANKSAFIVASGFADTTGTGTTNSLKVLAFVTDGSTTDGAVTPIELPKEKIAGVVQVYHNSPDPALAALDLYVGGIKQILGINFRAGFQSAGFIQDFDYIIDLHAAASSTSALNSTLRFDADSVVAVVQGVGNPSSFAANPDGADISLGFVIKEPTNIVQPAGTTKITVFHGATDAPTLDVTVPALNGFALISDLSYGDFQEAVGSSGTDISTTLGTVIVDLKKPDNSVYKSYLVPLAAFDGKAVSVLASGFVDSTANQNGKSFRLFVGVSSAPFPQIVFLQDTTAVSSINDPAVADMHFRMFPNPTSNNLVMAFDVEETSDVTIDILDITGRIVKTVVNSNYNKGRVALTENVSDLQSGTYITRVASSTKVSTYKFNVVH